MLAELLAKGQHAFHQHFHHQHDEPAEFSLAGLFEQDWEEGPFEIIDLQEGDSAQWAAGLLYAYTKQETDARDYIVGCSAENDKLDTKIARAYKKYGKEDYDGGNIKIARAEKFFRVSMADCEETNETFEEMAQWAHDFFGDESWRDTASANYEANKALVDQQWQYGMDRFNSGVYFDAGMFYGRTWSILATGKI